MAAIICALGQRRFAELFLLKLIKWAVKLVLKWVWSLSRQYVDDVRVSWVYLQRFRRYLVDRVWDNPIRFYFSSIDVWNYWRENVFVPSLLDLGIKNTNIKTFSQQLVNMEFEQGLSCYMTDCSLSHRLQSQSSSKYWWKLASENMLT